VTRHVGSVSEINNNFVKRYLAGVQDHHSDHSFYRIDNGDKVKLSNPHRPDLTNREFHNIIGKASLTSPMFYKERERTSVWREGAPRSPVLPPAFPIEGWRELEVIGKRRMQVGAWWGQRGERNLYSMSRRMPRSSVCGCGTTGCRPARVVGSTTNTQRPTLLGWAFSCARGPRHAGFGLILHVPPSSRHGAEQGAVRFGIALCSLETFANRFAAAHAGP